MKDCIEYQGKCTAGPMGYLAVNINGNRFKTHRLVAMLFHGLNLQDTKSIVLHTCDNPRCINPEHLRVGTQMDNIRDAMAKGRHVPPPRLPGEKNPKAKLTWDRVRQLRAEPKSKYKDLADKYGISASQVSLILRGLNWVE